ncbi:MAG: SIS domain-containing protein [Anaerolineaceae bacterium]|nr:SIS domain-containing protein [Anaerolineaceae bacterium]
MQRLLAAESAHVAEIARAIRDFNPAFVSIAARGTSDNAARYAQYLWGAYARLPVALATPSLHTLYDAPPDLSRALVIGVSQSGQAEDARRVLADAREQGAFTLSITNDPDSPMAQTAAHHISLQAGPEISIAATKTYTAELTVMAMLAGALTESAEIRDALQQLPALARETLRLSEPISTWAERYRYMAQFATIGRGYNYCTAFEVNLKITELCYITGSGFSEADFRHGPIAMIQPGFPVITVAPAGKTLPKLVNLLEKLNERHAENLVISNDNTALALAHKTMRLPNIPEWLSPIIAVLPGQLFGFRLAQVMGHPVDKPEGLSKVTVTE